MAQCPSLLLQAIERAMGSWATGPLIDGVGLSGTLGHAPDRPGPFLGRFPSVSPPHAHAAQAIPDRLLGPLGASSPGEALTVNSVHDDRVLAAEAPARLVVAARYRAALAAVLGARQETIDKLLDAYPLGRGLRSAPARELRDLGCTPAQARRVHAALGLGDAIDAVRALDRRRSIRGPRHAASVIRHVCREVGLMEQECFVALGLDSRQRLLEARAVALGSVAQVQVHPREVFRPLIRGGVHSVVLGHNHPSGDPEPSAADVELTRRIADVGRLVGIPVLDHVIVTEVEHVSFAQLGLLPDA